jgi:hypothetical protein
MIAAVNAVICDFEELEQVEKLLDMLLLDGNIEAIRKRYARVHEKGLQNTLQEFRDKLRHVRRVQERLSASE